MTVVNLGWKFECDWHGLGIGEWYGAEVIRKYLDMCGIGVLDDFTRMDFYWRGNSLEMDEGTHSRVSCLSC